MRPLAPVETAHLFPELRRHLLALLADLSPEEWNLPTTAGQWTVKDVALHILGGDLGNLARRRDNHSIPSGPLENYSDLVAFINRINHQWVDVARRLSPRIIIDLLDHSGRQADAYFMSLDPNSLGTPVSWAGPEPAPNWLDVAREYTERWHHQQQIRDATHRPALYEPRLFAPILDTFVRALPQTFRQVEAPSGTSIHLAVPGEAGGHWRLVRTPGAPHNWQLFSAQAIDARRSNDSVDDDRVAADAAPAATVTIPPEIAWTIFTRGLRGPADAAHVKISGDQSLGAKILETVSVIA
jgi:uncharacterized protein (TIGR03083 family)